MWYTVDMKENILQKNKSVHSIHESVLERVRQTITQHRLLQKSDHVVIGVSGGPDSVCLLHVLHSLRHAYGLTLTAVHLNHMLRAEAADEDQRYTQELCAAMDIACHCFTADVYECAKKWKMTTEEAGRKVRYDAFYQTLHAVGGQKIAVAQNQNDQAETVLMRLMRGAGTDGLSGIAYLRDGVIIRPLLDVKRPDIEAYCAWHHLEPRIDLTNQEALYTRNKIRLHLIPFIEEHFQENIIEILGRSAKIAQEDKDFLRGQADSLIDDKQCVDGVFSISKAKFTGQPRAIQKRMLLLGFAAIGLYQNISTAHLESALKLIKEDRTSSGMDFPGMYRMQISYDTILLKRPPGPPSSLAEEKASSGTAKGSSCKEKTSAFGMAENHFPVPEKGSSCNPEKASAFEMAEKNSPGAAKKSASDTAKNHPSGTVKKSSCKTNAEELVHGDMSQLPLNRSVYSAHFHLTVSCLISEKKPATDQTNQTAAAPSSPDRRSQTRIFDWDKIKEPLILRSRQSGDVIAPSGMTGSKKLKKFLIDEKVPSDMRGSIPLICAGHEVLWAVGLRSSEAFKADQNTRRYLILQIEAALP